MPAIDWTRLGGPGEVTWARVGDAATIAAGTVGGHLYLRRRTESGWTWERLGVPPGAGEVLDAALVADGGSGGLLPLVVGGDVKVWSYQRGATPTPWTGLSGPAPETGEFFFAECGDITASAVPRGAALRHTLVVSSGLGRPWIRQGLDPDGTWFRIAAEADWIAVELGMALASVAPGSEPQPHIFAVARDRETFDGSIQVALHENAVWTWQDVTDPPPGFLLNESGLSATAFLDDTGRLQACAVLGFSSEATVSMLVGSGRDWQWFDLGHPAGLDNPAVTAVVVRKGPDTRPGEPVVMARISGAIWTRTLTGDWKELGAVPAGTSVDPVSAVEVVAADGQDRVFTAGVSWDFNLWTFDAGANGLQWERHDHPGSVTSIVGAHDFPPSEHPSVGVAALDENGALWNCQVWRSVENGHFIPQSETWTYHGAPAEGVVCRAGVGIVALAGGISIFVIGSDGRLWARTADGEEWTWADHGAPTGRSVKTGVAPIPVSASPVVHVLADDGRLWMRSASGSGGLWTDRGTPPGQLIFAVIGAQPLPSGGSAAAVVTGDGHLWINVPDGTAFRWIGLGTPAPAEKIVAGIHVGQVSVPSGSATLDIMVVGSPSGQVWSHRWSPDGASQWTAHGRPADARLRATIGAFQDPGNPTACLMWVVGNDHQVWAASTAGGGWSRWDPPDPETTVIGGRAERLLGSLPCVMALDNGRRVHLLAPVP
ncbi:hypothetical protein [Nonomuraea candida]|uniref:hypothetical protein n=1 Tax=Nonomuraea candida TaxID=359159 RepID=UPI0005BD4C6D|nr:hypothetical protein [Nonomuraea candida]